MSQFVHLQPPGEFTALMGAYSHGIKIPLPGADLIYLMGRKPWMPIIMWWLQAIPPDRRNTSLRISAGF